MIYWDLDGVLRGLGTHLLGHVPQEWNEKMPNGQGVVDYIDDHLDILESAPALPYLDVALNQVGGINIISHQDKSWRIPTMKWMVKHLRKNLTSVRWVDKVEQKLQILRDGDFLIDDCPNFNSYEKIILIDWPYNKHIENPLARITSPEELSKYLAGLECNKLSKPCLKGADDKFLKNYCARRCDLYPCPSWTF